MSIAPPPNGARSSAAVPPGTAAEGNGHNTPSSIQTAVRMLRDGFHPVLTYPGAKRPIGKGWGLDRPDENQLVWRSQRNPGHGNGVCLGPGKAPGGGWLADIEGDGPRAGDSLLTLCGGEAVETLGWPANRGPHNLFIVDQSDRLIAILPTLVQHAGSDEGASKGVGVIKGDKIGLPDLELRLGMEGKQLQSIVPPTPKDDGTPRQWNGNKHLLPLPEAAYAFLENAARTLGGKRNRTHRPKGETRAPVPTGPRRVDADRAGAWFRAALEGEADTLARTPEGDRNNQLNKSAFKLGGLLHHGYFTEPEVVAVLTVAAGKCGLGEGVADTIASGLTAGMANPLPWPETLDIERNGHAPLSGAGLDPKAAGRVEVEVIANARHFIFDQAVDALMDGAARLNIYRFGRELVQFCPGDAGIPANLSLITADDFGVLLNRRISFYKMAGGGEESEPHPVDVDPPSWLCRAMASNRQWSGFRPVVGIAECPYVRRDGFVVTSRGYDRETRSIYWPDRDFPAVPPHPTIDDAGQAAYRILDVVSQFPFAGQVDRAVYLAAVLTVVQRPMIRGPVPGFTFVANRAGTGKGLLINTISIYATGRPAATTPYPRDDAEAEKVKLALALSGKAIVHWDNIDNGGQYGGSAIDSALTSTVVSGRVLGTSRQADDVPIRVVHLASGNNISPCADAHRRWIPCNLNTDLERPECRMDIRIPNLEKHVAERRGELVRDALTILAAHAAAGRPGGEWGPLGSFEEWDEIVRRAVWWATGEDPVQSQRKAADESPDRLARLALLEAWHDWQGDAGGRTADQAFQEASRPIGPHEGLRAALMAFSRDGRIPPPRQIGSLIRGMKGTVYGDWRFEKGGDYKNAAMWTVKPAASRPQPAAAPPPPGEYGEFGESIPNREAT
jgi:hypothetical protein